MPDGQAPYKGQVIPVVVTIFASLLTVQYLYTITNQRELLCAIFLVIYIIAAGVKDYVTTVVYPERSDGKIDHRRLIIMNACDLITNIAIVVITRLIFDIFISVRVKIDLAWWDYIVLASLGFTFVFSLVYVSD